MNQTDPVTTHQELCGRTEELDYFQHPMINDSMKEFLIVGSNQQLKVIHKENSRFLKRFFPSPCLYHELNMIIHTRYINI